MMTDFSRTTTEPGGDPGRPARSKSPADIAAFAISAAASPFLVLPAFAVAISARYSSDAKHLVLWALITTFFSTGVPFLFILFGVLTGRITDLHVMRREQRGGPFAVALASSAMGCVVLSAMDAPMQIVVPSIGVVANGVVFALITTRWKISMHPSVYTAAAVNAALLIDSRAALLLLALPIILWARVRRARHSVAQGVAAILAAAAVSLVVLAAFGYGHPQP